MRGEEVMTVASNKLGLEAAWAALLIIMVVLVIFWLITKVV
jgi:hypothetical protein